MGQLIVFYLPANFKTSSATWIPPSERGKIIEFQALGAKKSA